AVRKVGSGRGPWFPWLPWPGIATAVTRRRALCAAWSLLRLALARGLALLEAVAAKHVGDRLVPFVARVLVDQFVLQLQRNHHGPRRGPRRRVVHRELVFEDLRPDAREALGEPQVLVRPREIALRREVRRVDDERVAFPVSARVAVPAADAGVEVRAAVERNDARVVRHLAEDGDVAGRLDDLEVTVVTGLQSRNAEVHAALTGREHFRIFEGVSLAVLDLRRAALLRLRGHRRE